MPVMGSPRSRQALFCLLLALLVLGLGCGGDNAPPPDGEQPPPTSGIMERALVSNNFFNGIVLLDREQDLQFISRVSVGGNPTFLTVSPDGKFTLSFNTAGNTVSLIEHATEVEAARFTLPDWTEMLVISPDSKLFYAPVRNANRIVVQEVASSTANNITVQAVRRIALSPDGATLLAFSDGSDVMTVVDTATRTTQQLPGFDRPIAAVFDGNDRAFVLNCGPECGGTTASVTVLDMTVSPPAIVNDVVVSAATTALLDGSRLFVAGTPPGGGGGTLDILDTSSLSVTKSAIAISDGFHHEMALASNGRLFVAARTCSNTGNGCLSIVNIASGTAVLSQPHGDATGVAALPDRDVVYAIEGGDLFIYSTQTDDLVDRQLSITGAVYDVVVIDR